MTSSLEEMVIFLDPSESKAQREKLQQDFLQFYNSVFFPNEQSNDYQRPTKNCFYKKGYEYLDIASENRYISYTVSTYF